MSLWDIIDWVNKVRGVIEFSANTIEDAAKFINSGLIEKINPVSFGEARKSIEKMDWSNEQFTDSAYRIEENLANNILIEAIENAVIKKKGFDGRIDISYKTHDNNKNCADIQIFLKDEDWVLRYLCWRIYKGRALVLESAYCTNNYNKKPDESVKELFYLKKNIQKITQKKEKVKPSFETLQNSLLYSDNLDKKIQAVHQLSLTKSGNALVELVETLKDPDGEMTLHASLALATFGKEAVKYINNIRGSWSTTGLHPSRNTPINLRERLLYPLALLGNSGHKLLEKICETDSNETVRTSADDLLFVLESPVEFVNNTITASKTSEHLEWNLPPGIDLASQPISLGIKSVNKKVLSVAAVLCSHQGLFGTGLRGSRPVDSYYNMITEKIATRL